ncbi:MAG TPA: hypothetical protein V6D17_16910 [Candidatus Obscuribacterales bacterium]
MICRLKNRIRSCTGNYAVEVPGVMAIIFLLFFYPLLNLGTMGLRYGLLMTAAREGANAASKSYTFEAGSAGKPSALAVAPVAVSNVLSKFRGVSVQSLDVDIIRTDITTGATTRFEGKLPTAADSSRYVYEIETDVTGQIQPLNTYSLSMLGNIPGLTAPAVVRILAREFSEAPDGLNK